VCVSRAIRRVERVSCVEVEMCQCYWVAHCCVGVRYVIEMNMIHGTYLGYWLSGVRCRAAGCQSRKRDPARLALSSGIGRANGQLEQRIRVAYRLFGNVLPFLVTCLNVELLGG
jgi:hypothetical protein